MQVSCRHCGPHETDHELLWLSVSLGSLGVAVGWFPFGFVALCGLSIFDAYAFVVLVARAPRLRIAKFSSAEKTFVRALVVTSLGANWGYLLLHWRNFY